MNKKQENETIQSVLNGDREKFALFVDKYKGPVFNLVYRLTGSRHDAEDLAQETFIKAYKALNSFQLKKKFFPWLYTIAINLTRNHLKKKKPLFVENVEDIINLQAGIVDGHFRGGRKEEVKYLIDGIDGEHDAIDRHIYSFSLLSITFRVARIFSQ